MEPHEGVASSRHHVFIRTHIISALDDDSEPVGKVWQVIKVVGRHVDSDSVVEAGRLFFATVFGIPFRNRIALRDAADQAQPNQIRFFDKREHLAEPQEQLPACIVIAATTVIHYEHGIVVELLVPLICKSAVGGEKQSLQFNFGGH